MVAILPSHRGLATPSQLRSHSISRGGGWIGNQCRVPIFHLPGRQNALLQAVEVLDHHRGRELRGLAAGETGCGFHVGGGSAPRNRGRVLPLRINGKRILGTWLAWSSLLVLAM